MANQQVAAKIVQEAPVPLPITQQLAALLGKHIIIDSPAYNAPFVSILKYVGKTDIITNDGLHFSFSQVKAAE